MCLVWLEENGDDARHLLMTMGLVVRGLAGSGAPCFRQVLGVITVDLLAVPDVLAKVVFYVLESLRFHQVLDMRI